jgi:protein TonB
MATAKPAIEDKSSQVAAPKLDIPLQGTGSAMASVNGLDSRITAPPAKWDVEKKPVESETNVPVTRKLVAVSRVMPVYPWRAKSLGTEGWVKVEVIDGTDGTVSKVTVIDDQPKDIFAEAAVTALKQWRFEPAYVEGRLVAQRAIQVLEFQLK